MTSRGSLGVAAEFERLLRELDRCLAEIIGVASSAARTTGPSWHAIVEAMTGQPPGGLPPAGDGANPAEVRAVLIAVHDLYDRRLAGVEHAIERQEVEGEVVDAIWTFRHRRLDRFVEDELAAYIKAVRPRPSVGGVFARAANQARASAGPVLTAASRVQLHRCKTCAAPRLGDGLYGNCVYCGHPFFTGREEMT